ncbi:hypothetical protein, partial [Vibrio parahaemolyticus]|uniref:hypothetical protein n=1 Tax=Vibrio parahaemolyticus TaxID=670 RepID=UPI002269C605
NSVHCLSINQHGAAMSSHLIKQQGHTDDVLLLIDSTLFFCNKIDFNLLIFSSLFEFFIVLLILFNESFSRLFLSITEETSFDETFRLKKSLSFWLCINIFIRIVYIGGTI